MAQITFTPRQQAAITTSGQSVIVSAAAGSGKTAVLAQRCAYLVCDAPPASRCNVDQLLVVTFTDAAATEMRSRIVEALRERANQKPADRRLCEQVALVDSAAISTVHAFCHRLIRRWFAELELDPAASLMDEHEAALLRSEVLDDLFRSLYPAKGAPDQALGSAGARVDRVELEGEATGDTASVDPRAFTDLIEVYGLSIDRDIAALVLKLSEFVSSLTEPDRWLEEARDAVSSHAPNTVLAHMHGLPSELERQAEYIEQMIARLRTGPDAAGHYIEQLAAYAEQLAEWLRDVPPRGAEGDVASRLDMYDRVCRRIGAYSFSQSRAPTLPKDAPPGDRDARKYASQILTDVKTKLFRNRLRAQYGLFSAAQWAEGLARTSPFVTTVTRLVESFRHAYALRKRKLDVLDFSDLERLAYSLLSARGPDGGPSEAVQSLRRKYAYVLADEFQDINPIQQAIMQLVSRESVADLADNLFVVGDIKQSIYRFRLAEPALFAERWRRFRDDPQKGKAIPLQTNFRSRPEILDTVNLVFRHLMGEGSEYIDYDEDAELVPREDESFARTTVPVDLHLLERTITDADDQQDEGEPGATSTRDPRQWSPIEREGHLIGKIINSWMSGDADGGPAPPLRFRDMAVLLRASRINASRIAAMLSDHGIPSFAGAGGSLIASREVRDVWAALQVLDNPQQDIPLAAVLRNGVFGESLAEDELVTIRCHDRSVPFHEAVRRFAGRDNACPLGDKLNILLSRIQRHRWAARRRPLADVIWSLYEHEGFLGYTGGLPNGLQRRANLLKLHELARKFGTFRHQGLHRFLRFVESLEDRDLDIAAAPSIGEGDDVVRIMSIHQSKGLEFPVVFVAGLGTRFNLGDRTGRMIFERTAKIGLRVIDTERMIEYPSAIHARVAAEVEYHTRDEEARILYVAMTRAREKMVLLGSVHSPTRFDAASDAAQAPPPMTRHNLVTAQTPLDWLSPVLANAPEGMVAGPQGRTQQNPTIIVHTHDAAEIAGWSSSRAQDDGNKPTRSAVASLEPLPASEPAGREDDRVAEIVRRTEFVYPHLASAACRAVASASEFKGTFDYHSNPEERSTSADRTAPDSLPPQSDPASAREASMQRGRLTHRALEHMNFAAVRNQDDVASELQRMVSEGVLCVDERNAVDEGAIAWFVGTPLGNAVRQSGDDYRREFSFIATEPTNYFDATVGTTVDDNVLVRGIVDGILLRQDGVEVVDFKTDRVDESALADRTAHYRPQMTLYARAMSRLWRKPVEKCWLVFLTARRIVEVTDLDVS